MKNLDIRMMVSEHGLRFKDVAKTMGVSREWLSRLLRTDLTIDNKVRIMQAIEKLTNGVESNDVR